MPKESVPAQPVYSLYLFWVVCGLLLFADMHGPFSVWKHTAYGLAVKSLINLLAACWLYFDSQYRQWPVKRSLLYSALTLLLLEVVIPLYVLQTRGLLGGLATLTRFLVRLLATLVVVGLFSELAKYLGYL